MASIPIPAVFVGLTDPRLFPSEEDRERDRVEAREKALPPSRPVLYTTVGDDPPANQGCKGKCDFKDCECIEFAGKGGECSRCKHANLYHRVKIRRVDLEAKAAAAALKHEKHRRHIPTQREIDEQKVSEENKPPEPVNTYPCDVADCECKKSVINKMHSSREYMQKNLHQSCSRSFRSLTSVVFFVLCLLFRMLQPAGWDSSVLLPKLCRGCKHAEMYHVKRPKDAKAGRSGGTGKGSSSGSSSKAASAANTARGTSRSGSASTKKAASKKK